MNYRRELTLLTRRVGATMGRLAKRLISETTTKILACPVNPKTLCLPVRYVSTMPRYPVEDCIYCQGTIDQFSGPEGPGGGGRRIWRRVQCAISPNHFCDWYCVIDWRVKCAVYQRARVDVLLHAIDDVLRIVRTEPRSISDKAIEARLSAVQEPYLAS